MTRYSVDSQAHSGTDGRPTAKTSPLKVLQEMMVRGITGCLTIHDSEDESVAWKIYMTTERLTYATSAVGKAQRLPYLLSRYGPKLAQAGLEVNPDPQKSEYEDLCRWCRAGHFPLDELRKLLLRASQEAIAQAVAINRATIQFSKGEQPDPIVLSVPIRESMAPITGLVRQWESLRPKLPSAFARLELNTQQLDHFCEHWETSQSNTTSPISQFLKTSQMSACMRILGQKSTLYESALALNMDPLTLATWLHPLAQSGTVKVFPYQEAEQRTVVACIDDSKTVQRQVKLTLQVAGYDVLGITEPAHALTALVRARPALILMDVNMPEIDGYELSRMLRQSKQLKDIPIVMLTGRDGLLDRLQAKLLGVTEYVTKPFDPSRLLQTVQKLTREET